MEFKKRFAEIGAALDDALDYATEDATAALAKAAPKAKAALKSKAGRKAGPRAKEKLPSADDLRAALRRVIATEAGHDGAIAILADFGVKKVAELDEAEYGKAVEACETLLDEGEESDPTE